MADNLFGRVVQEVSDRDKNFIIKPGQKPISYAEAFSVAAHFAHVLANHGVVAGDRVAVQVEKCPEALFLYLACLRMGAIYLPLNIDYTPNEVAYFVQDAEPRVFVCSDKNREKIEAFFPVGNILTLGDDGTSGSLVDEARAAPVEFSDAALSMDDPAAILYTSGTTGRSKGAMLSHGNLYSNAQSLKETWRYCEKDILLHALPIFHTHGLFVATNVTLLSAASMIFLPKFNPDAIFLYLPEATVMMGVPTFYTRLLQDSRLNRHSVRTIRLFISGSAPLLKDTHRAWQERTGHAILERYGMTETNMNTSNPYDGLRLPGSVGLPLPGVELRIADKDGNPLAKGEIGMIEVRGPNVFTGYWRMPEKTAAEFRPDGFFITGDLGTIDDDGYVHIVGRDKDLIITGGFNVYPKEIESRIDALPGIEESAVVGLPHGDFGEGVTAFVVTKKGAAVTESAVLEALAGDLAKFKLPKRVVIVEQLPRNSMGKVQKNLMRDTFRDLYGSG
ncbi:MAG TPA: malonyl-CoA synthase [Rhizomicrobium sp.]|nr:malonyl-CoA synthase [Rhizomicrobium sp.]